MRRLRDALPNFAMAAFVGSGLLLSAAPLVAADCVEARKEAWAFLLELEPQLDAQARSQSETFVAQRSGSLSIGEAWESVMTGAYLEDDLELAAWAALKGAREQSTPHALANAGTLLLYIEKTELGMALLHCAESLGDRSPYLYEALASGYQDLGDALSAQQYIEKARAMAPDDPYLEAEANDSPEPESVGAAPAGIAGVPKMELPLKYIDELLRRRDEMLDVFDEYSFPGSWAETMREYATTDFLGKHDEIYGTSDPADWSRHLNMSFDEWEQWWKAKGAWPEGLEATPADYLHSQQRYFNLILWVIGANYVEVTSLIMNARIGSGFEPIADILGKSREGYGKEVERVGLSSPGFALDPKRAEEYQKDVRDCRNLPSPANDACERAVCIAYKSYMSSKLNHATTRWGGVAEAWVEMNEDETNRAIDFCNRLLKEYPQFDLPTFGDKTPAQYLPNWFDSLDPEQTGANLSQFFPTAVSQEPKTIEWLRVQREYLAGLDCPEPVPPTDPDDVEYDFDPSITADIQFDPHCEVNIGGLSVAIHPFGGRGILQMKGRAGRASARIKRVYDRKSPHRGLRMDLGAELGAGEGVVGKVSIRAVANNSGKGQTDFYMEIKGKVGVGVQYGAAGGGCYPGSATIKINSNIRRFLSTPASNSMVNGRLGSVGLN